MSGVNKAILVGRLGADPELRYVNEDAVCNFNIATSEQWTDKAGERQERTEWHRISVWGKVGENCAQYLAKGRQVYVEGRIETKEYEKDGEKRWSTSIVARDVQFLGSKDDK